MAKKPEEAVEFLEGTNTLEEKPTEEQKLNTLDSVNIPSIDRKVQQEDLKKASKIVKGKKVKFKCSSVYATLYPDGFISTYQGIIINLIFDNRTVELSEAVANYVERKIQEKADKEAERVYKFRSKKQKFRGDFIAGE